MDSKLKQKTHFSGSTPPEIFVGKYGYPEVNTGILSPLEYGDTEKFSSPEKWFKEKATIQEILKYRDQLLYSRFKTKIKLKDNQNKLKSALDQVALAKNSVAAEFFLSKPAKFLPVRENSVPPIGNPAPLKKIILQENPKIPPKVDYISSDTELKAVHGIQELYKSKIQTSNIIKILSAGLLGRKLQRKMVPTRWAITATDDTLSKQMLKQIRFFQEINQIQLFNSEYLGNHYEILLLPDRFSFEIIEIDVKTKAVWQDHESFLGRKKYAFDVTGGYYAVRLPLCEHLTKIRRQAYCILFREVRPEYNASLGVGILRELTRQAFTKQPEKFSTVQEALQIMQSRMNLNINEFTSRSKLLPEFGKQRKLVEWF